VVDGQTALAGATSYGNFTLTMYLISRGANPNTVTDSAPSPLVNAVESGSTELVTALIHAGAQVDLGGALGETPLMRATTDGNVAMLKLLLKHGANVAQTNEAGATALYCAADAGTIDTARALLTAGSDANAPNKIGYTPLMAAAWKAHADMARLLLTHGASVNHTAPLGESALTQAIAGSSLPIVQMLLAAGASPDTRDTISATPLMRASAFAGGNAGLDILSALLAHGATVDAQNNAGQTALMYACAFERHDAVNLLLAAKADPTLLDNNKGSALIYLAGLPPVSLNGSGIPKVAKGGSEAADRKLAATLVQSTAATDSQQTADALCVAAGTGRIAVLDGILDAGAPVDSPGDAAINSYVPVPSNANFANPGSWPVGVTPLMVAAAEGKTSAVRDLLAHGANPAVKNTDGSTAADLAVSAKQDAIYVLLQNPTPK
jgi:ankyrin repeat protein